MCIMDRDSKPIFIPTVARQVYDVSGAGDNAVSTLALVSSAELLFPKPRKLRIWLLVSSLKAPPSRSIYSS
jgi:bifunctional ADP-heptose synthase (sugar kinase/adenylyltransferase)